MLIVGKLGSTMLFGVAANSDNLAVGLAYGMKRRPIRWRQNVLIAVLTTIVTLLALAVGRQLRALLADGLSDTIGGIMLISLAIWGLYREGTAPSGLGKHACGVSCRSLVGLGETLVLACALSINNIGLAIAGGIVGVGYLSAAASIFCFSVVMLAVGVALGANFTQLRFLPQVLRYPLIGNGVLALAGAFVLVGY